MQYCMHACGSIQGLTFTNALEALEYWYANGIKMFEADIDDAGNGKFVACHDFKKETFKEMEIEKLPERCTYEWFQEQKLFGKTTSGLTPMTLEDIFQLLVKYQDISIMIDPKVYSYNEICILLDTVKCCMEQFQIDGRRIVFETYTEDMILATGKYDGMIQYQFCIEDERQTTDSDRIRKWDLSRLIGFLKKNNIRIISYPWKYAVENLERLKILGDEGFFIFSRTKNDILAELLRKSGVNVNIVDYLVTDEQRERLQSYKKEYYEKYKERIDMMFE